MRFAAFAFLGMATGAPASVAASSLNFLPGATTIDQFLGTSFVAIGPAILARLLCAPILDAHSAPRLGQFDRRRGWITGLLPTLAVLAIAVGLLMPSPGVSPSPVYLGVLVAAMIVAGCLFAVVDGLRSAQPASRTQGILAVGQYAGTIVPVIALLVVTKGGGDLNVAGRGLTIPTLWLATGFLAAGWIGLWLLPGKDTDNSRPLNLPRVQRLSGSGINLSTGGLRLTAWLYGVFICPVIDFFERYGPIALLALLVLLLGNGANQWAGMRTIYSLYPNMALANELISFNTAAAVLNAVGLLSGGALAFWLSPIRGFVAALLLILLAILANTIAALTAPALAPPVVAYLVLSFARGAFFIALVALIGRLVTPRFAAFQFSLLMIVALPGGINRYFATLAQWAFGIVGTHILFLVITLIAIMLAFALARRLEPDLKPLD
ncbi:MAG TPA: hypothetical protein VM325_02300 [Alphaproteobacteria bacterium]|nr:hypothetical protein [Alphaproteobacteria bacterium]